MGTTTYGEFGQGRGSPSYQHVGFSPGLVRYNTKYDYPMRKNPYVLTSKTVSQMPHARHAAILHVHKKPTRATLRGRARKLSTCGREALAARRGTAARGTTTVSCFNIPFSVSVTCVLWGGWCVASGFIGMGSRLVSGEKEREGAVEMVFFVCRGIVLGPELVVPRSLSICGGRGKEALCR